jgi:hypothetical protein
MSKLVPKNVSGDGECMAIDVYELFILDVVSLCVSLSIHDFSRRSHQILPTVFSILYCLFLSNFLIQHSVLLKIPIQVRFGFHGFISNALFMMANDYAVTQFQDVNASTIFSVVYLIFIPVTHAILSLLVFGWPDRYVPSLMSNFPIGITAIGLGASLTAYLDRIDFDEQVVEFRQQVVEFLQHHWSTWVAAASSLSRTLSESSPVGDKNHAGGGSDNDIPVGEFYSSLLVLFATGIWTFVLSVVVNAPTAPTDKKEL